MFSPVQKDQSTVVSDILVHDRQANINHDVNTEWMLQELCHYLPGVKHSITLIVVISTTVPPEVRPSIM